MQSCFDSADAKKHHSPTCSSMQECFFQAKKQKGAGAHGGCPIRWVIVTIPAMLNFSGSDPPMTSRGIFKKTWLLRLVVTMSFWIFHEGNLRVEVLQCSGHWSKTVSNNSKLVSSQGKQLTSFQYVIYTKSIKKFKKKNLKYCGRHSATAAPSSKFINWIKCLKATGQNYINWKLQISTCSTNTKLNTKKHITAGHLSIWKNALQQNQQNSPIQSKPKIQSQNPKQT